MTTIITKYFHEIKCKNEIKKKKNGTYRVKGLSQGEVGFAEEEQRRSRERSLKY